MSIVLRGTVTLDAFSFEMADSLIIQLETHAISLWVEELLDAVRKGRKVRAERFQTLAEDIAHLRISGKDVVVKQLIQALKDVDSNVQQAATRALKNLGTWISENDLLLLLRNYDADVRRDAVEVLGSRGDQMPIDRLLPLLENPSSDVRWSVVQVLGTQRKQLLITLLIPYLYQKDEDVRQSAIKILEMHNEPISRDLFMNLLSDESSDIRQIVLHILQKQSSQTLSDLASQALSILDGRIEGQVFPTLIQMQVADAIGDLGIASTTLLEKLTELLDWPHWQVRIKAAQAVGKIRRNIPDAALQHLLEMRRDPDPNMGAVRDAADDALAEILSLETGIEDD